MGRVRRGNYVLIWWKGDHSPRHGHVYREGKFIVKWDLENGIAMQGHAPSQVLKIIRELREEGVL